MQDLKALRERLAYHQSQSVAFREKARTLKEKRFGSKFFIFAGAALVLSGFFIQLYNSIIGAVALIGGLTGLFIFNDPSEDYERANLHYKISRQIEDEIAGRLSSGLSTGALPKGNSQIE